MKKIVIINGSPRKGGNSDAMTEFAVSELQNKADIEVFIVREHNTAQCVGCNACMDDERGEVCVFRDDAAELVERLFTADAALLITPLYFMSVPGIVKVLFDRFYVHYNFPKGLKTPVQERKAAVAWTYGGSPDDVVQSASEYVAYCFRDLRYGAFDDARCPQCKDKNTFISTPEYQSRLKNLCEWLVGGGNANISGRDFGISRDRFAPGAEPPEVTAAKARNAP